MAVIDTLKLARELREKGGFSQEAAEATAAALNSAIDGQVASKADIAQAVAELRAEMGRLHNEILKWMFGQTFVILAVVAALHFVK